MPHPTPNSAIMHSRETVFGRCEETSPRNSSSSSALDPDSWENAMQEFKNPWESAMHEFQSRLACSLGLPVGFERCIKAELLQPNCQAHHQARDVCHRLRLHPGMVPRWYLQSSFGLRHADRLCAAVRPRIHHARGSSGHMLNNGWDSLPKSAQMSGANK